MHSFGSLERGGRPQRTKQERLAALRQQDVHLFFFSRYELWHTSTCGNRFLLPVVALAALPLASLGGWAAGLLRRSA